MNRKVEVYREAKARGYYVDETGQLMSPYYGPIGHVRKGYVRHKITVDGVYEYLMAHRLAAFIMWGDAIFDEDMQVRHMNGNSLDNRPCNLMLGSQSDNMMDQPAHVRRARAIHASKHMQVHDHAEVYAYYCEHRSYKKTMKRFGISSKGTLNFIIKSSRHAQAEQGDDAP